MKFAYYPGCSLHTSAQEYDSSWKAVAERLDIELAELDDWNCCGTVHANSVDRELAVGLSARNVRIADEMGLDLVVPCSGCYMNLRKAEAKLRRSGVPRYGTTPAGVAPSASHGVRVKHPLYVILEDIGLGNLGDIPKPLHGLRVAPYYGCMLTRPPADPPVDDPEDPQGLDRLLGALGADVVPYPSKTKCCGGAVLLSHSDVSVKLIAGLLTEAKAAGAECVAVACPMCQMALDAYQAPAEKLLGESLDLPILYFTQLLGLSLGLDTGKMGLNRLLVSPRKVLALA